MKNSQIKELIQTHFPTFSKLARLSYRQITFALVTLGIVLSMPGSATAWTWVLHHNGHSPTPTGPSINGGGRLIQRQNYNPGSNSQRWSFVENGNGRHMLMNLATKKCMNVYLAKPQSRPNDYLCNRDDKEQQFRVRKLKDVPHSQPAMDVMIQVADIYHNGKGLCLDDANGHFQLHYCNQNNTNMVFRMDRVSTFIASDIVNQGTQASRSSGSSGGSNGNQGNTLPRSGGPGDIFFDGLVYTYNQFWKLMAQTMINTPKNSRKTIRSNPGGVHFQYVADWGVYERRTGVYAESYINNLENWLEQPSNGIKYLTTALGGFLGAKVSLGFGAPTGAALGGYLGTIPKSYITTQLDFARSCYNATNEFYVRWHLVEGSWKNVKNKIDSKSTLAFAAYPSISCD